MRVISWNCRRAGARSKIWKHLLDLQPDVAILQEVSSLPHSITEAFSTKIASCRSKNGGVQSFKSVVLVLGTIESSDVLDGTTSWVKSELLNFAGDLLTCTAVPQNGSRLRITNVHSPAWPIDRGRMAVVDTSGIKLTLNKDVWVGDILWDSLRKMLPEADIPWIIAGDFNLSETFDSWKGGPRGNKEYLQRTETLGLVECLRRWNGHLTPTYLNKDRKGFVHQIDHMFLTKEFAALLTKSVVGTQADVLEHKLSDHLPIISDFERFV